MRNMTVCIKIADVELDSVRALMTMTLHALVADLLRLDPDALHPEFRLRDALAGKPHTAHRLRKLVAEYFDDAPVVWEDTETLRDLCRQLFSKEPVAG